MSSKDERIVEMVFDNAQFEKGVEQTRRSLKELDQSLEFKNATDGFSRITSAANGVDLSAIAKGVESLQDRFSLFGIMGMKIMEELATSAINVGKKIWSATFGQIKTGGINRAMNIENAHFMLQGLLKDEEKVQEIMGWAMDSVDGTAYAFDSAAKAASQFAASGVTAEEDMTKALKAITGVAAMTNSEYEDISRIFTTVAGNGRLMGDQLLQLSGRGMNAASTIMEFFNGVNDGSKTASEGVTEYVKSLTKGMSVTESDIRDFVSKGKINFDVFSEAMNEAFGEHAKKANETLTGVLSNVKAALSKIGADFVSPLIVQNGPLVDFFNALRQAINRVRKELGPFQDTFVNAVTKMAQKGTDFLNKVRIEYVVQAMAHGLELIKQLIAPIGEAFRNVFGETTMFQVNKSIKSFKEFVLSLQVSERAINNIRSIFGGFFATLSIGKQIFNALLQLVSPLIEKIFGFSANVADATASVGDHIMALDNWLKESGYLSQKVEQIQQAVGKFVDKIKAIVNSKFVQDKIEFFKGLINNLVGFLKEKFGSFEQVSGNLETFFTNMKITITNFLRSDMVQAAKNLLSLMIEKVGAFVTAIFKGGKTIISTVRDVFASFDMNSAKATAISMITGALNLLGEAIKWVGGVAVDFSGSIGTLFDGLGTIGGGILNGIIGLVQSLTGAVDENGVFSLDNALDAVAIAGIITIVNELSGAISNFTNNISSQTLKDIAEALGILTLALIALANIEKDKLEGAVGTISLLFGELVAAYQLMRKSSAAMNGEKIGNTLRKFIGAFTGKNGFNSVIDSLASLAAGFKFKNLVDIAKAILILSASVVMLSLVPKEKLMDSVGAISAMMLGLTLMFRSMSKIDTTKAVKTGSILVSSALAILVLSAALKSIASLDMNAITNGVTGLAYIMIEMGLLAKSMAKNGEFEWLSSGAGLVLVATSILILTKALKSVAVLNPDQITTGMIAIAAGLMAMAGAVAIISRNSGAIKTIVIADSIFVMTTAMVILAGAMSMLAKYNMGQMLSAIMGLSTAMGLMVGAVFALNKLPGDKKMLSAAFAIEIMSVAFAVLAGSLSTLAKYDMNQMLSAIAGLGSGVMLMISAFYALNQLPGEEKMYSIVGAMGAMALVFNIFALALGNIAKYDLNNVLGAIAGLGSAMLFAIAALTAIDKLDIGTKKLYEIGGALGVVAIAMVIFSSAIAKIAKADTSGVAAATGAIAAFMLSTAVAFNVMPNNKDLIKFADSFILMSVAMVILASGIKKIADCDTTGVTAAIGALSVGMLAMSLAFNIMPDNKDLIKIADSFILMSAAMSILASGISKLAKYDVNSIAAAAGALGGTLALMALAFYAIPDEKNLIKIADAFILMGAATVEIGIAFNLFGAAIKSVSDIPIESIGAALFGLGGSLALAVVALSALSTIKADKLGKTAANIIAMGLAMTIFAKAIKILDGMSVNNMLYAVLAIGIALGTVALTAALLVPLAPGIQKLGLAFLAFGGGVAAAGIGIAAAVASIAGFIVVLMKLADLGSGAIKQVTVNIAELLAGVAEAIGGAIRKFVSYFDENSDEFIRGMIGFFEGAVGAVIAIIPGAILGIAVAFGDGFKRLADSNAVYDATDGLMRILTQAADGVGKNAEPLVNALVDALIAVLKTLGERTEDIVAEAIILLINLINGLAEAVVNYSDPLVNAIENIFKGIIYFIITILQEVFRLIPGVGDMMAEGMEGIKNEIADSMTTEEGKKLLHPFGHGMEEELLATRDRLQEHMYWTFNMPEVLPEEWKAAQLRSISLFGTDAMANYVMAIEAQSPEVQEAAMKIINSPISLAEKQKQLYETVGGEYIDYFAYGINSHQISVEKAQQEFLAANEAYAREAGFIAEEAATDTIDTIEQLTPQMKGAAYDFYMAYANDPALRDQLVEEMRNDGRAGVAAYIDTFSDPAALEEARMYAQEIGYGTAEELAQEDKAVESAQKTYMAYSQTIKEEGPAESKEAADAVNGSFMDELGTYVQPAIDKGKEIIGGYTGSIEEEIPNYQDSIDNLMDSGLTEIDGYEDLYKDATEKSVGGGMATGASSAGDNYLRIMKGIGTKGPLELVKQKNEFKGAGNTNIGEYSAGMNSSAALRDMTNAIANAIVKALQKILSYSKEFNAKGAMNSQEYAKGLTSKSRDVENAGANLSKSGAQGANSNNNQYKASGQAGGKQYSSGIEGMKSVIKGSGSVVAKAGAEGAGSRYSEFKSKGHDAGDGFAIGMDDKNSKVYQKAWNLAGMAIRAMKERIDSNSPSKETMKLGNFAGDGFAIGIEQYGTTVKRVSEDLAEEALTGLQNGIEQIAKIADMDMDYAPTIRPVIDLSSVMDGITAMDTMFDESHAVAAQASFDMYNAYSKPDYIQQFAKMTADNESKMAKIIDKQTEVLLDIRTRLAHQQIVLDSGELVGATINKIDDALGERMYRAERGN